MELHCMDLVIVREKEGNYTDAVHWGQYIDKQFLLPTLTIVIKVEKILKDSLDSIQSPSPSMKIQIMGGKVCLMCKGKHCWALSTNF